MNKDLELLTINQACDWASSYLKKNITQSNISYLIQYGRIKKYENNGLLLINKSDLQEYYQSYLGKKEVSFKSKFGEDLNWNLSFDYLKEADTTKHVHRLHPYKGKFIPQLVEYFLDSHTDEYKKEVFFKKDDIILDPFCGSGTTLVQANELGINGIGIDISYFNSLISNVKVNKYELKNLYTSIYDITRELRFYVLNEKIKKFEDALTNELFSFNNLYFPSPEYKIKIRKKEINETLYAKEREEEFKKIYSRLLSTYNIRISEKSSKTFLSKWFFNNILDEIKFTYDLIQRINNDSIKNLVIIILSRTIRSCRATRHYDLATLKDPIYEPYYCYKHGKICKPIFSILKWWERYSKDTIKRVIEFDKKRTNAFQVCLTGDSRNINLLDQLKVINPAFSDIIRARKINGIFTSPPYVGLIDYHEQHAYAYELFNFVRNDSLEIGSLSNGRNNESKLKYIDDISQVLNNCSNYLKENANIFIVANDKLNLYQEIAKKSNLKIINKYKRPVLNRTERDKEAYYEEIFHLMKI